MGGRTLFWCGPDSPPPGRLKEYAKVIRLNTFPQKGNVFLKFENISTKLAQEIPSIALDFLEIGSYVYCADQSVTRGGKTWPNDGKGWVRNFILEIPVRNDGLWNDPTVKEILSETLGYLSDDNYEFAFRKLQQELPADKYFEFEKGDPWFNADEVLLFSGGLDSLAGTIDEIVSRGRKVVLVSHRPVAKISNRQLHLLSELKKLTGKEGDILHVPVWLNKDQGLTKDTSQRTRSFMYAMLAACVAVMHKLNSIKFYENGIVSTNLPISEQIVGGRASRSTHPKVLNGYSQLLSNVLNKDFQVINPYYWKTKSDVVQIIKNHNLTELVKSSGSCIHTRSTDTLFTHCGVCSQCIERRIATLFCGLTDEDPEEMYKTKLFMDPMDSSEDKAMLVSYFSHAKSLDSMTDDDFFQRFGEAHRVVKYLGLKPSDAGRLLFDLHKRQGQQVCTVIDRQIKQNAELIRKGKIPAKSLLAILIEQPKSDKDYFPIQTLPTPEGAKWEDVSIEILSADSAKITVNGKSQILTAYDMGFKDRRKGNLPNFQWQLLLDFADAEGVLNWASRGARKGLYKQVNLLRKSLSRLFRLKDPPIKAYQRGIGYVPRFKIKYSGPLRTPSC